MFLPLLALALAGCKEKVELPRLYQVPPTSLIADSGAAFSTADLHGKVAVYDFIFTHCSGTCPIITKQMQMLVKGVPSSDELRFVSLSVDPQNDTPQVLHAYAERVRNDKRWLFLTGERDQIVGLSVNAFKLAAGAPQSGAEPILHSTKFVLVDRAGWIRGYYNSLDGESRQKLHDDIEALLEEK